MATKMCRVCGKEYEACRTAKSPVGAFRWRDVACSRECGAIYLERVTAARSGGIVTHEPVTKDEPVKELEPRSIEVEVDIDSNDEDVVVDGIVVDDCDDCDEN